MLGTSSIHAGGAVGAEHHAHFLQHVAVVVDAGFVEAEGDGDAFGAEAVERGDAGAEAEIAAAIVADAGAGLGDPADVALGQPDAVPERHARVHQAEAVEILDRGAAAAAAGVFLLVGGLHQVHVQLDLMAF